MNPYYSGLLHWYFNIPLQRHHNERNVIPNHRRLYYLLKCLFRPQRKHWSSTLLALVRRIYRWPVDYHHKEPIARKTLSFDDVIMQSYGSRDSEVTLTDMDKISRSIAITKHIFTGALYLSMSAQISYGIWLPLAKTDYDSLAHECRDKMGALCRSYFPLIFVDLKPLFTDKRFRWNLFESVWMVIDQRWL